MDSINIDVQWQTKGNTPARKVRVHFNIEPVTRFYIGYAAEPRPKRAERPPLDPLDFQSKDALIKFLADLTRTKKDGETVEAVCFDDDVSDVLKLLDISGPVPDPIPVPLPANA